MLTRCYCNKTCCSWSAGKASGPCMEFAAEKCQVLTITRKHKKNIIVRNYEIHNHVLDRANSAKYLGIILDSKLSFREHINSICKKANSTRQFLQRTLARCDRDPKVAAYKTFVRPILDYGSSVWDPHHENATQTGQLESVQNKAVRFVCSNWRRSSSVSAMRDELSLTTLQERRARACLCMMYKVTHHLVAIPSNLFPLSQATMTTRGAPQKFLIPPKPSVGYRRTFVIAAPTMWNGLPAHIIQAPDLEVFSRALSTVVLTA